MRMIEKQIVLQALDTLWREHLVALDHLRQVIGWRGMAQRDPLNEYKSEAFELFKGLMTRWDEAVTTQLMRVEVSFEAPPSAPPELPPMEMSHPNPEALIGGGAQLALDDLNTRLAGADFSARGLAVSEAPAARDASDLKLKRSLGIEFAESDDERWRAMTMLSDVLRHHDIDRRDLYAVAGFLARPNPACWRYRWRICWA